MRTRADRSAEMVRLFSLLPLESCRLMLSIGELFLAKADFFGTGHETSEAYKRAPVKGAQRPKGLPLTGASGAPPSRDGQSDAL